MSPKPSQLSSSSSGSVGMSEVVAAEPAPCGKGCSFTQTRPAGSGCRWRVGWREVGPVGGVCSRAARLCRSVEGVGDSAGTAAGELTALLGVTQTGAMQRGGRQRTLLHHALVGRGAGAGVGGVAALGHAGREPAALKPPAVVRCGRAVTTSSRHAGRSISKEREYTSHPGPHLQADKCWTLQLAEGPRGVAPPSCALACLTALQLAIRRDAAIRQGHQAVRAGVTEGVPLP